MNVSVRHMFAFDSFGALISALMLGVLLVYLQPLIGMPKGILITLAVIAFCFCLYSFYCFQWNDLKNPKWFLGIMIANVLYCLLTLTLVVVLGSQLTVFGRIYFFAEIAIIAGLVLLERSVFIKHYKQ